MDKKDIEVLAARIEAHEKKLKLINQELRAIELKQSKNRPCKGGLKS